MAGKSVHKEIKPLLQHYLCVFSDILFIPGHGKKLTVQDISLFLKTERCVGHQFSAYVCTDWFVAAIGMPVCVFCEARCGVN